MPALLTEHPELPNFSEKNTSQTTFFPEQLPVAAFDGSSQMRRSREKGFLKNSCSEIPGEICSQNS